MITPDNEIIVAGYAFAFVLLVLFAREIVVGLRVPKEHPDRGLYWFNGVVLFLFALGAAFAVHLVDLHRLALRMYTAPYPGARYAPEREGLDIGKEWIYVTSDSADRIVDFYENEAKKMNMPVTVDQSPDRSVRILYGSNMRHIFITVKEEGGASAIYYTREGKVTVTKLPASSSTRP